MTHFSEAEKTVHYPADRRSFAAVKPYMLVIIFALIIGLPGIAWLQYLLVGLPVDTSLAVVPLIIADASGFPIWLNLSHWVNFFFLVLIIRSGLSILADHPRLYWNNSCKPETAWIRFTPLKIPKDKFWTAKEDARYISPVAGLPGYRHTIGIARVWHFLTVLFFVLNGAVFYYPLILYQSMETAGACIMENIA